jgi:hypothetical protein
MLDPLTERLQKLGRSEITLEVATPEFIAVREKLVGVTRSGPALEWVDRLRDYAVDAGLNDANIKWNQTPQNLAHEIVKQCSVSPTALGKLLEKLEFFQ